MNSKRFSAFTLGWGNFLNHEDFICPDDEDLVFRAFLKFFLKYSEYGARYVIFAAPTVLGEIPSGEVTIKYYSREEKLPVFIEERILKALLPELKESVDIVFERVYVAATIENLAWKN